jgi:hypothetical protein
MSRLLFEYFLSDARYHLSEFLARHLWLFLFLLVHFFVQQFGQSDLALDFEGLLEISGRLGTDGGTEFVSVHF